MNSNYERFRQIRSKEATDEGRRKGLPKSRLRLLYALSIWELWAVSKTISSKIQRAREALRQKFSSAKLWISASFVVLHSFARITMWSPVKILHSETLRKRGVSKAFDSWPVQRKRLAMSQHDQALSSGLVSTQTKLTVNLFEWFQAAGLGLTLKRSAPPEMHFASEASSAPIKCLLDEWLELFWNYKFQISIWSQNISLL